MDSGTKLAQYEIVSALGKGGMGEVWRAKDTKLGREVAIKTLPEEFAKDADRLARFEREAKLLASLNHPNIAAIYGLEEHDGTRFLVLELVEGPTLGDRIKQGAIPVEESLKLALQIAEALEAAHEKGVIHRDLKPANIKITPDGKVKVLDFGLAKAFEGDQANVSVSNSPTLSMAATQQGIILGTAAYMSPEQARGDNADQRADVWAFGVVLFEMLTGRGTFDGPTVSDVLAAVLAKEPEWETLPTNLQPRLRALLERCLAKERRNRYGAISDARVDIEKALADPSGVIVKQAVDIVQAAPQSRLPWVAAVVLALVTGLIVWSLAHPSPPRVQRFVVESDNLQGSPGQVIALSPDGRTIVYVGNDEGTTRLYRRPEDQFDALLIPGSEGAVESLAFSPDGEWIAFVDGNPGSLMKIQLTGGTAIRIVEGPTNFRSVSWGSDDTIVFGSLAGLWRVSADGGVPEQLTRLDEGEAVHVAPDVLPGGEAVLFEARDATGNHIELFLLDSMERRRLNLDGTTPYYATSGHLVYAQEGVLWAAPFDLERLSVDGAPLPVLEGVATGATEHQYAIADSGSLAYMPGLASDGRVQRNLLAVDSAGNAAPLTDELRDYFRPQTSPDGTRVAVEVNAGGGIHIWVVDIESGLGRQLTFEGTANLYPTWTPDSRTVVFQRDGVGLYTKAADGSGEAELLLQGEGELRPTDVSSNGVLAFYELVGEAGLSGIWTLQLEDGSATEFLATPADERMAMFSPDGQWLAYVSDEFGQNQVYVRPYPQGTQRLVSGGGGTAPIWSRSGEELYYRSSGALMAVPIQTSPTFIPGRQRELFPFEFRTSGTASAYDTHGEGFIVVEGVRATVTSSPQINIVLNWFEELKERVPVP